MKKNTVHIRTAALRAATAVAALALAVSAQARDENPGQWYNDGQAELQRALQRKPIEAPAKNVILFIGDGMGISTVTAARIFEAQSRGESGEENALSFEQLPYVALAKTYATDQQVAESASTMTALMTGIKTKSGLIGLNQQAERGNCSSGQGKNLETLLEQAEKLGKGTGIVATSRITHATPAATYAHAADRDWESDADMPAGEREAGCKDIARQLIEFPLGNGIDVVFGGGRTKFLPNTAKDPKDNTVSGERADGRDLVQEWQKKYPTGVYAWNAQQFSGIDAAKVERVLGLFAPSHLSYEKDRPQDQDANGEPSLAEMTRKAIEVLQKNPKGFFLMVEGGRIDHAHHAGNAYNALNETREFANAVRAAMAQTDSKDTLVVVTADHGHALNIVGYPRRGNPILGKVVGIDGGQGNQPAKALDELPYTTLGYANGPGAIAVRKADSKERTRRDLGSVDTAAPDYRQQALVPLAAASHSGEDVPIYAGGPWAHLFQRTVEQNYVFHVMRHAMLQQPKAAVKKTSARKRAPR